MRRPWSDCSAGTNQVGEAPLLAGRGGLVPVVMCIVDGSIMSFMAGLVVYHMTRLMLGAYQMTPSSACFCNSNFFGNICGGGKKCFIDKYQTKQKDINFIRRDDLIMKKCFFINEFQYITERKLVQAECVRCPWLKAETKVATILVREECVRCPWLLA